MEQGRKELFKNKKNILKDYRNNKNIIAQNLKKKIYLANPNKI